MGFFDFAKKVLSGRTPLRLHNTLTDNDEVFELPVGVKRVRMYNCGPTVYDTSHIGNLRSYVFADLIHRTLEYNGFEVKQVINITDFGHLSSDADQGSDKMSTALKRAGLSLTLENMKVLAEKYAEEFIRDLKQLNIDTEKITFPRASEHIAGEIALIRTLEEKGYTYRGHDGVYYDTSRFPAYGALGNINLEGLKEGARVATTNDKQHATDFLLWKSDANIGWDSPWGKGFPGWHIECSAMINATLGKQIDIHTGGIDLMPTHHNNEIAQSEAATGKRPLSRFWLHHEFLNLNDAKISKSAGNMLNLSELTEQGFNPLAYRYFLLGAHYRKPLNFSWEALEAAENALERLSGLRSSLGDMLGTVPKHWESAFLACINNDLDTPRALAVLWNMTKDKKLSQSELLAGLLGFDKVLGLGLSEQKIARIPETITALVAQREQARDTKEWIRADELREEINALGYVVEDTESGPHVSPRRRN